MNRRTIIAFSVAMWLAYAPLAFSEDAEADHQRKAPAEKELNANKAWLREAKWGVFTHYLAHTASTQVPEEMNGPLWNPNG